MTIFQHTQPIALNPVKECSPADQFSSDGKDIHTVYVSPSTEDAEKCYKHREMLESQRKRNLYGVVALICVIIVVCGVSIAAQLVSENGKPQSEHNVTTTPSATGEYDRSREGSHGESMIDTKRSPLPTKNVTIPTVNATMSTENVTMPTENATMPTGNDTMPTENTTMSTTSSTTRLASTPVIVSYIAENGTIRETAKPTTKHTTKSTIKSSSTETVTSTNASTEASDVHPKVKSSDAPIDVSTRHLSLLRGLRVVFLQCKVTHV